jgi:alpha-beta hydrolase superfamily lysophospholipase
MEGLPCFLFGESMGGAVALKAHLKYPDMWDGAILVAPMCKIADSMYPPWYLVQIMIALAHIIPKAKLVTNRDIAEIGFRDLVKRKRVCDLRFKWCTTHFFVCSLLLLIGEGH